MIIIGAIVDDCVFSLFILMFGGDLGWFTKQAIEQCGNNILISIIFLIIMGLFNAVMCYFLYKKNKENGVYGYFGKHGKLKYLLVTYFLGMFGVHKFMINDKKGGIIRLLLLVFGVLSLLLGATSDTKFVDVLSILFLGCSVGLTISDFIIGISKQSKFEK